MEWRVRMAAVWAEADRLSDAELVSRIDELAAERPDDPLALFEQGGARDSTGDEAGSALGVMSNKIKGVCEYMMYSFDVKYEGKNVCRLADPLFHNDKNGMG